jgi:hypothetical protein
MSKPDNPTDTIITTEGVNDAPQTSEEMGQRQNEIATIWFDSHSNFPIKSANIKVIWSGTNDMPWPWD